MTIRRVTVIIEDENGAKSSAAIEPQPNYRLEVERGLRRKDGKKAEYVALNGSAAAPLPAEPPWAEYEYDGNGSIVLEVVGKWVKL